MSSRDTEFDVDMDDASIIDISDTSPPDLPPRKDPPPSEYASVPEADVSDGQFPWDRVTDDDASDDDDGDDLDASADTEFDLQDEDDASDDDEDDASDDDASPPTPAYDEATVRAIVESRKDVVRYQAQAQLDSFRQQRDSLQVTHRALMGEVEFARRALIEAKEHGTAAEELEAQERYTRATQAVQHAERVYAEIPTDEQVVQQANAALSQWDEQLEQWRAQQTRVTPAKVTAANDLAKRWMARNPALARDPAKMQAVAKIDAQLSGEGRDTNSPAYFRELNRRLAAQGIKAKPLTSKKSAYGAPVGSSKASGRTNTRPANRVKITAADKAEMRRFNFDPTNKDHLAQWARATRDLERMEQR